MKNLFDLITEHGLNERMDALLLSDPHYQELLTDIDKLTEKLHYEDTTINELIAGYTAANTYYQTQCYKQGFFDCIELLKTIKIL